MNVGWIPKRYQEQNHLVRAQIIIASFGGSLLLGSLSYYKLYLSVIVSILIGIASAILIFIILTFLFHLLSR